MHACRRTGYAVHGTPAPSERTRSSWWREVISSLENAGASRDGDVCDDKRAAVGGALDPELAVQDGKAVCQPEQSAAVGPRAADAVVAHPDTQGAVVDARRHRGVLGVRVLDDVGEGLGDDEVRAV